MMRLLILISLFVASFANAQTTEQARRTIIYDWVNSGSSGGQTFNIPAAFDTYFASNIRKQGGTYTTDYSFTSVKNGIAGDSAYVDPTAAGGGNGTIGAPYNSLATALANTAFNKYLLKRGTEATLTTGLTISRAVALKDYGNLGDRKPIISSRINLGVFAAHATYANVFQAANPQTAMDIGSVSDGANLDVNLKAVGLVRRTTVELVRDNANSYFYDATADILYVRLFNNRQPDSNVACYLSTSTFRLIRFNQILTANTKIYIEDIDVYGANPLVINNTSTSFYWEYAFRNCEFSYAGQKDGSLISGYAIGSFYNCRADYNFGDGFNYSNSVGFALEWNCDSWFNNANSDANNGSTSHLAFYVIRVLGDYQFSGGKGVQDINDVKSLSIGCTSINSTALTADHRAGFASNSATGVTEMWLWECIGPTTANKFWLFNNSTMHIFDGDVGNLLTGSNRQDVGGVLDTQDSSEVFQ